MRLFIALVLATILTACGTMDRQERNTAIGAGLGAAAGAAVTDSALGTAAGAVAGGVIGHEVSKDKK